MQNNIDRISPEQQLFVELTSEQAVACSGGYGAIAYSLSTGKYGWSQNLNTYNAAKNSALKICRFYSGTRDCSIVVSVKNGWASLATATNRAYGYGWNTDKSKAQSRALAECRKRGPGCSIATTISA